jgi:hypothetical protein
MPGKLTPIPFGVNMTTRTITTGYIASWTGGLQGTAYLFSQLTSGCLSCELWDSARGRNNHKTACLPTYFPTHAYPAQYYAVQLNAPTPKGSGTDAVRLFTPKHAPLHGMSVVISIWRCPISTHSCRCCNLIEVSLYENEQDPSFGDISIITMVVILTGEAWRE